MAEIKRLSPVRFDASPIKTEKRDNWTVVLEYDGQGHGPWLADLCHMTRWDFQDRKIGELIPGGGAVPPRPGQCAMENGVLINRMNATQASVWHLGASTPERHDFSGCTDVTDATVFLALFGPKTFLITEKLCSLDFQDPKKKAPFLLQGPFCNVPCQMVALKKNSDASGGLLMTCSRGYAESMVDAILRAGAEFGLRAAGETRFLEWLG